MPSLQQHFANSILSLIQKGGQPSHRPSVAVLPFENFSTDPEQAHFADAVVEEITATLSRIGDFLVIARNSAFTYKGRSVDVRQVGRELNVRYVVEGSVRRVGERVRITAQLVETDSGRHIWAGKAEGATSDLFDLQDRIAEMVAGAVYPSVRKAEIERARMKRPDNLEAYDLVMRALPHLWAHRMHENPEAIALLDRSLKLDPHYGLAAALCAWARAQQIVYNWTDDVEGERRKGLALIETAARHIGDDATGLTALGTAVMLLEGNARRALGFVERAVLVDPNHAWAWMRRGFGLVYTGKPEEASAGLCAGRAAFTARSLHLQHAHRHRAGAFLGGPICRGHTLSADGSRRTPGLDLALPRPRRLQGATGRHGRCQGCAGEICLPAPAAQPCIHCGRVEVHGGPAAGPLHRRPAPGRDGIGPT